MPVSSANSVPSVERALTLLESLADSRRGLSVSEMSRKFAVPKSSIHLLARTLERRGYLRRNTHTGKYHLGLRLVDFSRVALESLEFPVEVRPLLQELMRKTGLTVHLGVLSGNEAVLIDKVSGPGLIQLATWVGRRMEVHCTGVGKALVAFMPEAEFNRWIVGRGLTRHNQRTIVSVTRLREELAQVRRLGYSLDDEEDEIGLRCVGAPIFGANGQVVAAVSVAGTKNQIPLNRVPQLGHLVRQTAGQIAVCITSHSAL